MTIPYLNNQIKEVVEFKGMLELIGSISQLHGPLHLHIKATGVRDHLQGLLQGGERLVVLKVLILELAEALLLLVVHLSGETRGVVSEGVREGVEDWGRSRSYLGG